MSRHYLLLVLLFLLPCSLVAQDSVLVTLRGIVTDHDNGRRLPDVQVHVGGSNVATMTNADGRFSLRLAQMPEQLLFSSIGYATVVVGRDQLEKTQQVKEGKPVEELQISLQPRFTFLNDVFVYSPENILNAAIERRRATRPSIARRYRSVAST